jgi:hypothetical protein
MQEEEGSSPIAVLATSGGNFEGEAEWPTIM